MYLINNLLYMQQKQIYYKGKKYYLKLYIGSDW